MPNVQVYLSDHVYDALRGRSSREATSPGRLGASLIAAALKVEANHAPGRPHAVDGEQKPLIDALKAGPVSWDDLLKLTPPGREPTYVRMIVSLLMTHGQVAEVEGGYTWVGER